MKRGPAAVIINSALGLAAAFALFPLLWMVSVSFMQPGAASSYPPPLMPADATLQNYRDLFARANMGGYLLNSLVVACGLTVTSVLFNVMAGYAFAKLQFAGREGIPDHAPSTYRPVVNDIRVGFIATPSVALISLPKATITVEKGASGSAKRISMERLAGR